MKPVRDAEGKIDVQGTTQAINNVIEGWVREHPEQWLWAAPPLAMITGLSSPESIAG